MSPYPRWPVSRARSPLRGRIGTLLPWVFVLGVAAGTMLPDGQRWLKSLTSSEPRFSDPETEAIWRRASVSGARYPAEALYTVDGDTFEARVHLWPGLDMSARVRLRGIDAPEMKGQCADELRRAEAAATALRAMLAEGGVTITNIGPDKYGRVLADVATKRTDNVAAALIAAGHGRPYNGGHRGGWCLVR